MTIYALPMDADPTSGLPAFPASLNRVADAVLLGGGSRSRPLGARSGWRPGAGPVVTVSGVTATIQPIAGVIDTGVGIACGPFRFVSDAVVTKTITAANGTYPRSDILYAQVSDQPTDSSGQRKADIGYLAGTATGPSAPVPATPARSLRLGVLNVPVSGGGTPTFTTDRVYSTASGGVLPVATLSELASLAQYEGLIIDCAETNLLYRSDGSMFDIFADPNIFNTWSAYAPSWTGEGSTPGASLGTTGVAAGYAQKIGSTMHWRMRMSLGGTGVSGPSGIYRWALPGGYPAVMRFGGDEPIGDATFYGGQRVNGVVVARAAANGAAMCINFHGMTAEAQQSNPGAWQAGSVLIASGTYEVAP